jgi:hypothetical protein
VALALLAIQEEVNVQQLLNNGLLYRLLCLVFAFPSASQSERVKDVGRPDLVHTLQDSQTPSTSDLSWLVEKRSMQRVEVKVLELQHKHLDALCLRLPLCASPNQSGVDLLGCC